jgi:HTH-type transcriptional regulator/antitoxin HigA
MIINSPAQFAIYKEKSELLLKQICQYEDEHDVPNEIIYEYKKISDAIIEYESAYHPLPGKVSTIITDEIVKRMKERQLRQKTFQKCLAFLKVESVIYLKVKDHLIYVLSNDFVMNLIFLRIFY